MVEPSGTNRPNALVRQHLSVCAKQSRSNSGDALCHDSSAETMHKLQTTCQRHEPDRTTLIYIPRATPVNI